MNDHFIVVIMVSKTVIFFFVALFAIQGIAQAASAHDAKNALTDQFFDLIKKIQAKIDKAIDDFIATLPALKEKIQNGAKDVIDNVKTKVQDVVDDSFALIDKLQEEAQKQGIDIHLCIDDQQDDIHKVANGIVDDTADCVQSNIVKFDSVLDLTINTITEQRQKVKDLQAEFENCDSFACSAQVILKAQKLIVSVPIEVGKIIVAANSKIVSIQVNIAVCLTSNLKNIQEQLKPIVDETVQCISDKLHGSNKIEQRNLMQSRTLLDKILALIDKIQTAVNNAVQDALNKLPLITETLKGIASGILDGINTAVHTIIDTSFAAIDKLKEDAEKLGINVDLCIGDQKERIQAIANEAADDTNKCVQTNLDQADEIVKIAQNSIQGVLDEVKKLQEDVKACGSDAACLLKEFLAAQKLVISLPLKVADVVLKTQAKIVKIQVDIGVCLTKNTVAMKDKIEPIVTGVTKCISDKIHGLHQFRFVN